MPNDPFFNAPQDHSKIKADIVAKYFVAWSRVITSVQRNEPRVAYIDLFAGPGRYEDGANSTPLLVLKSAIEDANLSKRLVTLFNDADENHSETLKNAIAALPGIERLAHKPQIETVEVDEGLAKGFEEISVVPAFVFIDPFGYKGLSLRLIRALTKDWGCDCLFFFNYNRINMGIANPFVGPHMDALFGAPRAAALRTALLPLGPAEREALIVENLCGALQEHGLPYVLPFRFRRDSGRTGHHLIFVSKHPLGYRIMKEIMAAESSTKTQGVPSFEYYPAGLGGQLLFELSRPLDDLGDMLLSQFPGQTMTVLELFERHNVGRPFVLSNYKACLNKLESDKRVVLDPPAAKRRPYRGQPSMPEKKVRVTFP